MFLMKSIYLYNEYHYVFKLDSKDNGIEYMIFYTTDSYKSFNANMNVSFNTKGNIEEFEHYEIDCITNEPITNIRIDFGKMPGLVGIKNFEVVGRNTFKILNEKIISGMNNNIDEYELKEDYLEISSQKNDPYSKIFNPEVEGELELRVDILDAFSVICLIFLIIKIVEYLYKKISEKTTASKAVYVLIVLFIIGSPIIFLNNKKIDEVENRSLAEFPQIFIDGKFNQKFTTGLETWLNDRFGFRRNYIEIYDEVSHVFQSDRVESAKVFLGEDDWIFYKGDKSIENFQGINLYTEEQLESIKKTLVERTQWFEKQGIKYYILVTPDKNSNAI